ncbi:kinase-like domain-containing protein, partial [Lobosporangium transversale]
MVLQFAGKGSLRDYLSRHFDSLNWANKMRLARDVAAGISFIHEDNICHHDLHSRNVLIDQSGRALITDFGLSRYVNHANSNNGVRGVVPYISPERLKNAHFDHSSDVYSLGVIMWELTSGYPPFDHDGENFLLPFQIMRGRREKIVPGTPIEYSNLYQQCWDGEPSKRPPLPVILKTLDKMLSDHNG